MRSLFPTYVLQRALDLLFPPQCLLCQRSGNGLCLSCQQELQPDSTQRCSHCHTRVAGNRCMACSHHRLRVSGLRTFGAYQQPLSTCIHALKYEGNTRLAQPLGTLLARTYSSYGLYADALLPIPLHRERQQQRGYNHALLLAKVCSQALGIPLWENLVQRERATAAQVGLSAAARRMNVAGAFQCVSQDVTRIVSRRKVIIIDDVCTTGATLEACAEPLFAAGASEVWGLVLARTY